MGEHLGSGRPPLSLPVECEAELKEEGVLQHHYHLARYISQAVRIKIVPAVCRCLVK